MAETINSEEIVRDEISKEDYCTLLQSRIDNLKSIVKQWKRAVRNLENGIKLCYSPFWNYSNHPDALNTGECYNPHEFKMKNYLVRADQEIEEWLDAFLEQMQDTYDSFRRGKDESIKLLPPVMKHINPESPFCSSGTTESRPYAEFCDWWLRIYSEKEKGFIELNPSDSQFRFVREALYQRLNHDTEVSGERMMAIHQDIPMDPTQAPHTKKLTEEEVKTRIDSLRGWRDNNKLETYFEIVHDPSCNSYKFWTTLAKNQINEYIFHI